MSNHSFDIHVATEYKSVEVAILVWHFQYWIMKNKRLGINHYDGRTWSYQTQLEIVAVFPYFSRDQVKRLLKKAIELDILIKGNFNKSPFDQTSWYAFKNEEKFGISRFREMDETSETDSGNGRNRPMKFPKSPIVMSEIAQCYKDKDTLPDTLTDKDRIASQAPPTVSSSRKKIREDKKEKAPRVWVTDRQEKALLEKINNNRDVLKKIYTRLSDWKIGKLIEGGKNDYGALVQWVIDAVLQDERASSARNESTSPPALTDTQQTNKDWFNPIYTKNHLRFFVTHDYVQIRGERSDSEKIFFKDTRFQKLITHEYGKRKHERV